MKRQLIVLLSIIIIIAICLVGIQVIKNIDTTVDAEISEVVDTSVETTNKSLNIVDKPADEIKSIEIQTLENNYTFSNEGDNGWIVNDFERVIYSRKLRDTISAIANSYGREVAGNSEKLEAFGLTTPSATITIEHDAGDTVLLLGNQSPVGDGIYAKKSDSDVIYILQNNYFENVYENQYSYIELGLFPSEIATLQIQPVGITIKGTAYEEEYVIKRYDVTEDIAAMGIQSYIMTSPRVRPASYEFLLEDFTTSLGITGDKVLSDNNSSEMLEKYNLVHPEFVIEYDYLVAENETDKIILSASMLENGNLALMHNAYPVIYEVSPNKVPWLDYTYQELVAPHLVLPNIVTLDTLTLEANGKTFVFNLNTVVVDERDETSVMHNVGVVDIERFKDFYMTVLSIPAETYVETPLDANSDLQLRITYGYEEEGTPDTVVELYKYDGLESYLLVNGEGDFLTKTQHVNTVIGNITALLDGGTIVDLY